MARKLLVVVATGEKEKALTGLLYATQAIRNNWIEDVKVLFLGPFETLVAEDEEIQKWVAHLQQYASPPACKFVADRHGVSEKLEALGLTVEYIGEALSGYINDDYVPMVW